MPLQSKLTEPVLPVEILEVILQIYFRTIYHDTSPSRLVCDEGPLDCAPSLVCKTFFQICRPLRLRMISGLQIDANPQAIHHLTKVAHFFAKNPHCRKYAKDLSLYVDDPVSETHRLECNLQGLKFPDVRTVTFLMPERPSSIHRRLLEMFMARYVASLKSVHMLELRGGSTTFLFPYLRIPGLQELSFKFSRGVYMSIHTEEIIPVALSSINTFRFSAIPGYRSSVIRVPFTLHALLLLPKLHTLELHGYNILLPINNYIGASLTPSFDLQTLSLCAATQEEIIGIFDFYEDQAGRSSVDPFTRLQNLNIQVEREQFPSERITQLLNCRMPLLQHLSLNWVRPSSDTSLEGVRGLYDKIAQVITSSSSPLRELALLAPSVPIMSTYEQSMDEVTGFLEAIQHKNQLRMLRLQFMNEIPERGGIPVNVECIYPAQPWVKIAELLKCTERFPRLETVIFSVPRTLPHRTERQRSYADMDRISNAAISTHIQVAINQLYSRKPLNIIITHDLLDGYAMQ